MYGLPADTNLDFLKRATFVQACFGGNDLILNFTGNITISIFSTIGVGPRRDDLKKYSRFGDAAGEILGLLNMEVMSVDWSADGTVTLVLESGHVLQVYDDSTSFESFIIKSPLGQLIV